MKQFERIFELGGSNAAKIIIYQPQPVDGDDNDWVCSYQILGLGSEKIKNSYGVDGLQAFLLALNYISTTLYFSDEFRDQKLTWLGSRDLGLPTADNVRDEIKKMT